MALKRTKLTQDKRKLKRDPRPGLKRKTALKSKLSDLRAFLRGASACDCNSALSALNAIIDLQRTAWIESSNLRDRILRGRL